METEKKFLLEVVSDAICPWCYVGKRRLETTLAAIGDELSFQVRWRPYELNPDMPCNGLERKAYRVRKFGSWERSLELDAQVKAAGAEDGVVFHHERIEKTPNTVASHVLAWRLKPISRAISSRRCFKLISPTGKISEIRPS